MADDFNADNIKNGTYNFDTAKYFFSTDIFRLIIIIYIIISFIINLLYFITSLKTKFKEVLLQINLILMRNILFINFLHTFSYLYEWVLQDVDDKSSLYINKDDSTKIGTDEDKKNKDFFRIGGLLVGNMDDMAACKAQGFFLLFSSLSQDLIVIIFFHLVNKSSRLSKFKAYIYLSVGYLISSIISIIYLSVDGFGLNDKYCFIKKFVFISDKKTYEINSNFTAMIIIYYVIRLIILSISGFILFKISKFISQNKLGKHYIVRLASFFIVQIFTVFVGIMYRIGGLISEKFSRDFVNIFLVVNTLDGVLFPLISYFSNNMYKNLFCSNSNREFEIDFLSQDIDETTNNQTKNDDKSGISTPKVNNNFEVSYI